MNERASVNMRKKQWWLVTLAGVLGLVTLVSLGVGAVWLTPEEVWHVLAGTTSEGAARVIVLELRLPRALLAACIGAGLASAGVAYQGLFHNPLAEPFVIGAASGAALGATVVIVSGWQGPAPAVISPVPLGAFVGAMLAALLTFALSGLGHNDSLAGLLLTGVAVGTLLHACVWVLMSRNDQELSRIVAWLMGSLAGRGWLDLGRVLPWLIVGIGGVWLLARPLDALAQGEETARGLGLRVRLNMGLVVACASLATAAAVAGSGIIGFVGLIGPHIARRLVGEVHSYLIVASALVGAMLLVAADALARTVQAPVELPVGIVTAALGGPFFLLVLRERPTWRN